jgi:hypothetical protein
LEERYRIEVKGLQADVEALTAHLHEQQLKAVAQDQRLLHVEKLLDEGRTRRWQVWLAFLGAILSAAIALTVSFVKR